MIIAGLALEEGEIPLLISALGALSAIITLFWKIIHNNHRETKDRGDKLEVKLEGNNTHLLKVTNELGELKGRVTIAEGITPKLDKIDANVSDLSLRVRKVLGDE